MAVQIFLLALSLPYSPILFFPSYFMSTLSMSVSVSWKPNSSLVDCTPEVGLSSTITAVPYKFDEICFVVLRSNTNMATVRTSEMNINWSYLWNILKFVLILILIDINIQLSDGNDILCEHISKCKITYILYIMLKLWVYLFILLFVYKSRMDTLICIKLSILFPWYQKEIVGRWKQEKCPEFSSWWRWFL